MLKHHNLTAQDIPEDAGRSAAGIAARRHVQELVRELEECSDWGCFRFLLHFVGGLWRSMSRSHMSSSDVLSTFFGWIMEEIHLVFLTIQSQETVRNRRDRTDRRTGIFLEACVQGKEAWMAFWELHGLYCLLSALLKRLEICSSAVQDYASFICFLPVHQAALLESCAVCLKKNQSFSFPPKGLIIFLVQVSFLSLDCKQRNTRRFV